MDEVPDHNADILQQKYNELISIQVVIDETEQLVKSKLAGKKQRVAELKAQILEEAQRTDSKSITYAHGGGVTIVRSNKVAVNDIPALLNHVGELKDYSVIGNVSVGVKDLDIYREMNDNQLPPGVHVSQELSVRIRKPKLTT